MTALFHNNFHKSGKAPVLLDVSRLLWRAHRSAPTGIDRVELAYALHFLNETARPARAVVHLFGLLIALPRARARRFVSAVEQAWREGGRRTGWRALRPYLALLHPGWRPLLSWRTAAESTARAPVYIVVSHHHLSRPSTLERLRRALKIRIVCVVHDLLPLEYPEYFPAGWLQRYQRLAHTLVAHADAVIAVSESTAQAVRRAQPRGTERAVHAAPLGISHCAAKPEPRRTAPYFVVLGTLEPRKNHLLLLNVWRRLVETDPLAPQLMIIGAPGWGTEQVRAVLRRSERLRQHVLQCGPLDDAQVAQHLAGACALLLPSFAEGYGLPIGEALAAGTPVLCSDIAPFRELGRDVPEYLDPLDALAWAAAIIEYSRPRSARRAAQLARLRTWQRPRWDDHFLRLEEVFWQLEHGRSSTTGMVDAQSARVIAAGAAYRPAPMEFPNSTR